MWRSAFSRALNIAGRQCTTPRPTFKGKKLGQNVGFWQNPSQVQHFGAEKLDNELNIKWERTFLMTCSKKGDVFLRHRLLIRLFKLLLFRLCFVSSFFNGFFNSLFSILSSFFGFSCGLLFSTLSSFCSLVSLLLCSGLFDESVKIC